jgi:hypothetical protein
LLVFSRSPIKEGETLSVLGGFEAFGTSGSFLPLQGINLFHSNLVNLVIRTYKDQKSSQKRKENKEVHCKRK